jgi:hypothetical protein
MKPHLFPGFELVSPSGDTLTHFAGSEGVIHDGWKTGIRYGVATHWQGDLPAEFRDADRLILRYVSPGALLVLQETWELPATESRD